MKHDEEQQKITFSSRSAWLGLAAYFVLVLVVAAILMWG